MPEIAERRGVDPETFVREIASTYRPAVLRGLADGWPAVTAAREGAERLGAYLGGFDRGGQVESFAGPHAIKGRFTYRPDMQALNFDRRKDTVSAVFARVLELAGEPEPPAVYMGAAPAPDCLPGFAAENRLDILPADVVPRIWLGNATVVSTHYDMADNVACVVGGRRRFTLFPPEQVANLYVGPLDFTPAGQPVSLVSPSEPDLERFPRFAEALAASTTVELEPGDALYIPSLWWHHVEALEPVNLLVNYWWLPTPADAGSPFQAMLHAVMALGVMPPERKAAWRAMYDHYVFHAQGDPMEHLEPAHRGVLGRSTPEVRHKIRSFVVRGLTGA